MTPPLLLRAAALLLFFVAAARGVVDVGKKKGEKAKPSVIPITVDMLRDNLEHWTYDYAVMFMAPWCPHCKAMGPIWEHIAKELVRPNDKDKSLVVGKFDCEKDDAALAFCRRIGITHYPTVAVFGFGPYRTRLANFFLRRSPGVLDKVVKYEGPMYYDYVRDWIVAMRGISMWYRFQRRVKSFLGWPDPADATPIVERLREDNKRLREENSYLKGIAHELHDTYAAGGDLGDIDLFAELSAVDYGDDYIDVLACLVDRAEQYCRSPAAATAAKELVAAKKGELTGKGPAGEKYCDILQECIGADFEPGKCRPTSCPLRPEGCEFVALCLAPEILQPYTKLYASLADLQLELDDAGGDGAAAAAAAAATETLGAAEGGAVAQSVPTGGAGAGGANGVAEAVAGAAATAPAAEDDFAVPA